MGKTCKDCGELKPLSEFYKHPEMKDGYLNSCRQCKRNYAKDQNKKEEVRCRDRLRRRGGKDPKNTTRTKNWRKNNPDKCARHYQKWAKTNKYARKAHSALRNAILGGKVIRPERCEKCDVPCSPEGHHKDYSKPLEVEWLCTECHGKTRHI